ncbi:GNAT family N-acetyltransferase [Streptomyces sp. NPDC059477]|uniref:GNAT family N-acetyltransferase n=1 Tax=Streptomyces sp. NPDC059477 TaxID=3346847 RepID=UPI00368B8F58
MSVVHLVASRPEFVWELRTSAGPVGHAEALDGESVWITRIIVQPSHRGHGYASLLLHAVLDYFPDTVVGLAACPLPTPEPGLDREELRAWYTHHGFVSAPLSNDPDRMLRPPTP